MKTLTCPKCGADHPSEYLRPGTTTVCLSCKVFCHLNDGFLWTDDSDLGRRRRQVVERFFLVHAITDETVSHYGEWYFDSATKERRPRDFRGRWQGLGWAKTPHSSREVNTESWAEAFSFREFGGKRAQAHPYVRDQARMLDVLFHPDFLEFSDAELTKLLGEWHDEAKHTLVEGGHNHGRYRRKELMKWRESEAECGYDEEPGKDDDNIYGKLAPEDHLDWR